MSWEDARALSLVGFAREVSLEMLRLRGWEPLAPLASLERGERKAFKGDLRAVLKAVREVHLGRGESSRVFEAWWRNGGDPRDVARELQNFLWDGRGVN